MKLTNSMEAQFETIAKELPTEWFIKEGGGLIPVAVFLKSNGELIPLQKVVSK